MVYRLLAAAVVLFWLTMTGLLLRKELGVGGSSLREVPVAHVARMMLQREQSSDLQIYSDKSPVGQLRLQPHVRREDGQRQFAVAGSIQLALPGAPRQRIVWSGDLDLDATLHPQRAKAAINLREPANFMVDLQVDFATKRLSYETHSGSHLLRRAAFTLDEAGARQWMREQGLDPALLGSLQGAGAAQMEIRAQQSTLSVRGEKIDTYLVTGEQSGQTLFEAHVSQLGQILRVRTMFGYSAAPEEISP